jgi:hypothetical protein
MTDSICFQLESSSMPDDDDDTLRLTREESGVTILIRSTVPSRSTSCAAMKCLRTRPAQLCLLVCLAATEVTSFSPIAVPITRRCGGCSAPLHLSTMESSSSSQSQQQQQQQPQDQSVPSWIDLPNKVDSAPSSALDGMELIVGRIAMIGATGIIIKEVFTGESVLEQCRDAFQYCLSHV